MNKPIPVNDRVFVEWRSEFFSMLNLTNFANPGGSITAATYGVIRNTTGNSRVIQLALKIGF